MKQRILMGIVLLLLMRPTSVLAQFIGGASFTGKDSLVATWSGKGRALSFGLAALGLNPPSLQNLGGVVQLILGSSYACRWATADDRWTLIPNSEAEADGLCQVLYYRRFQAGEHPPYRFRWFVTAPYDIRTYVIANVSGVDKASSNGGNGKVLTAKGVRTTEVGDYLMAFYANTGTNNWTPPSKMGIAVKHDYGDSGPSNFPNLATQAWFYPAGSTGDKAAMVSGRSVEWVADLVAFKPLYRIRPRIVSAKNPGPIAKDARAR